MKTHELSETYFYSLVAIACRSMGCKPFKFYKDGCLFAGAVFPSGRRLCISVHPEVENLFDRFNETTEEFPPTSLHAFLEQARSMAS